MLIGQSWRNEESCQVPHAKMKHWSPTTSGKARHVPEVDRGLLKIHLFSTSRPTDSSRYYPFGCFLTTLPVGSACDTGTSWTLRKVCWMNVYGASLPQHQKYTTCTQEFLSSITPHPSPPHRPPPALQISFHSRRVQVPFFTLLLESLPVNCCLSHSNS